MSNIQTGVGFPNTPTGPVSPSSTAYPSNAAALFARPASGTLFQYGYVHLINDGVLHEKRVDIQGNCLAVMYQTYSNAFAGAFGNAPMMSSVKFGAMHNSQVVNDWGVNVDLDINAIPIPAFLAFGNIPSTAPFVIKGIPFQFFSVRFISANGGGPFIPAFYKFISWYEDLGNLNLGLSA